MNVNGTLTKAIVRGAGVSQIAQCLEFFRNLREPHVKAQAAKRIARYLKHRRTLSSYEAQVFSQNGEDGIIAEIFQRVPSSRFFVEIGVEEVTV